MRPPGEIRRALLDAARQLTTHDRAPTLSDLAQHLQIDTSVVKWTVARMCRAGELASVRRRRAEHCKRPVAEYASMYAMRHQGLGGFGLADAMTAWATRT